jgi:hypothetical protein
VGDDGLDPMKWVARVEIHKTRRLDRRIGTFMLEGSMPVVQIRVRPSSGQ